jgi:putative hydrolase of the HAD superfamily
MSKSKIKVLFSDLGGVLLTNGWDHKSRTKAVAMFQLDEKEFESRHQLLFGDYEAGKISLATYLHYSVFYKPQPFSYEEFVKFMYSQSQSFPDMIALIKRLKKEYGLKIVIISNEGRELIDFRIKMFELDGFVDFFIVSCFLGIRKPDQRVWKMALDFVQMNPEATIYIDDRKLFIEIAKEMGIHALCHETCAATSAAVETLLNLDSAVNLDASF